MVSHGLTCESLATKFSITCNLCFHFEADDKGISPHGSKVTFCFEYPNKSFFNSINELNMRSLNPRWRTSVGLMEDCRTVRCVGHNEVFHIKFARGLGDLFVMLGFKFGSNRT